MKLFRYLISLMPLRVVVGIYAAQVFLPACLSEDFSSSTGSASTSGEVQQEGDDGTSYFNYLPAVERGIPAFSVYSADAALSAASTSPSSLCTSAVAPNAGAQARGRTSLDDICLTSGSYFGAGVSVGSGKAYLVGDDEKMHAISGEIRPTNDLVSGQTWFAGFVFGSHANDIRTQLENVVDDDGIKTARYKSSAPFLNPAPSNGPLEGLTAMYELAFDTQPVAQSTLGSTLSEPPPQPDVSEDTFVRLLKNYIEQQRDHKFLSVTLPVSAPPYYEQAGVNLKSVSSCARSSSIFAVEVAVTPQIHYSLSGAPMVMVLFLGHWEGGIENPIYVEEVPLASGLVNNCMIPNPAGIVGNAQNFMFLKAGDLQRAQNLNFQGEHAWHEYANKLEDYRLNKASLPVYKQAEHPLVGLNFPSVGPKDFEPAWNIITIGGGAALLWKGWVHFGKLPGPGSTITLGVQLLLDPKLFDCLIMQPMVDFKTCYYKTNI